MKLDVTQFAKFMGMRSRENGVRSPSSMRAARAAAREERRSYFQREAIDAMRAVPREAQEEPKRDSDRRRQLMEWKKAKTVAKKSRPRGRPPFKVGVVRHGPALFETVVPLPTKKSFAPPGKKFRPPLPLAPPLFPDVTVTRGKGIRRHQVPTVTVAPPVNETVERFKKQLDGEVERLKEACSLWEKEETPDENAKGLIDVAVGLTRLLIDQKLRQFRGLIERCESGRSAEGEGPVKPDDLGGFWDMVYMQVEDVDVKFDRLKKLKANGWKEEGPPQEKKKKKAAVACPEKTNTVKSSNGLRAMIAARRNAKATGLPPKVDSTEEDNSIRFDGGFFNVVSPMRVHNTSISDRRKSLRREDTLVPTIDLNKTPGKSILKTPVPSGTKVVIKKSVKILFSPERLNEKNVDQEKEIVNSTNANENSPKGTGFDSLRLPQNGEALEDSFLIFISSSKRKSRSRASIYANKENCEDLIVLESPNRPDSHRRSSRLKLHNSNTSESSPQILEDITESTSSKGKRKSIGKSTNKKHKSDDIFDNEVSPYKPAYMTRSVTKNVTNVE